MTSQEQWRTTVHNLILNFREALAALTSYMDRAKIGWRDKEAYDDWDEISQALYKNMIVRSVQFSIELQGDLITPKYGTVYPSYGDKSFVEVAGGISPLDGYRVFVGFSTLGQPFDQVMYQMVSGPDFRAVGEPARMPFEQAKFAFMINKGGANSERLSDLLIEV